MRITKTWQARRDLIEIADFIARDNLEAAERFLDAADAAFRLLSKMPEMGTHCGFESSETVGARVWSIREFENYLVFYRPIDRGIQVVRVLHGSRDIPELFADGMNH